MAKQWMNTCYWTNLNAVLILMLTLTVLEVEKAGRAALWADTTLVLLARHCMVTVYC